MRYVLRMHSTTSQSPLTLLLDLVEVLLKLALLLPLPFELNFERLDEVLRCRADRGLRLMFRGRVTTAAT